MDNGRGGLWSISGLLIAIAFVCAGSAVISYVLLASGVQDAVNWAQLILAGPGLFMVIPQVVRWFRNRHVPSASSHRSGDLRRGPLIVGEIPQAAVALQPRPELLGVLTGGAAGARRIFVLAGARGTGKTQVAGAHARWCQSAGWRLVAWVNAAEPGSAITGLAAVARALKLPAGDGDAEHAALLVRHRLEADGTRCLVVFDDVRDQEDSLWRYLPSYGDAQVVITTTWQAAADLGTPVPVDVFTMAEALQYLARRTGLADQAAARDLAAELGCLPVALARAAARIASQRLDHATFLAQLRRLPAGECLNQAGPDPYPRGMTEAVVLMLQAAQAKDETGQCAAVLDLIAVLSPAGTQRWILRAGVTQLSLLVRAGSRCRRRLVTPDRVDAALGRLSDTSLLTFGAGGSVVRAHKMTTWVVRERQAAEGTAPLVAEAAVSLLSELMAAVEQPWEHRARVRELVGHVDALRCHAGERLSRAGSAAGLVRLQIRAMELLGTLGDDPARVIRLGESLASDREAVLRSDHPDTLAVRRHLARAYRMAGQTDKAIGLFERILTDCRRWHGSDHPATLAAQSDLAGAYESAGRLADAIPLYRSTLTAREHLLGLDHPDTLAAHHNLAFASESEWRLARLQEAYLSICSQTRPHAEPIPLYERTLEDCGRVLGADHPSYLARQKGLTSTCPPPLRLNDALRLNQDCLAKRRALLGPDHPDTLTTRNNLASTLGSARRPAMALAQFEQTLAGRERVLGPDHPHTLATRNNIARTVQAAGRLPEAITLYEQNLSDSEHVLGSTNAETLTFCDNLAFAYLKAGYPAKAITLYERATDNRERELGLQHPITVISRKNLALACHAARKRFRSRI